MAQLGFGETIRTKREQRGWTQTELGDAIGESMSTISNWENEKHRPGIDQANKLIIALNLPAETFWQELGALITPPSAAAQLGRVLIDALLALPEEKRDSLAELFAPEPTDTARPRKRGR